MANDGRAIILVVVGLFQERFSCLWKGVSAGYEFESKAGLEKGKCYE
jgi:hypothetical protein